MKRTIACMSCTKDWRRIQRPRVKDTLEPPETVIIVSGPSLVRQCHCDACNIMLEAGDWLSCVSVCSERLPHYKWEHEFIDPVDQCASLLKEDQA